MLSNINSKYVINLVFKHMRNKRKLKIIINNKSLMERLDINKTDFQIYNTLKKLNQDFSTNIRDIDIKILDISKKSIGNKGLSDLIKLKINDLKVLNLIGNNISKIDFLSKAEFKGLNVLILSGNKISDLDALDKTNFKELIQLDLGNNQISDIDALEKVEFKELKILDLRSNEISDIDVLEKVNFKKLKKLNLNNNELSDIDVLAKVDFKELTNVYFQFK